MQRPGVTVTHLMWNFMDPVTGHRMQSINADSRRTFASILHAREMLSYWKRRTRTGILEPGLFQQSLGWLDEAGNGIDIRRFTCTDPYLLRSILDMSKRGSVASMLRVRPRLGWRNAATERTAALTVDRTTTFYRRR